MRTNVHNRLMQIRVTDAMPEPMLLIDTLAFCEHGDTPYTLFIATIGAVSLVDLVTHPPVSSASGVISLG
jgi:hypothetical protein